MTVLAAAALIAWQVSAINDIQKATDRTCTIRYEDAASGLKLTVEKRDSGAGIVTAFAVSGKGVVSARLVTANTDSNKLLKPAKPHEGEAVRAEALLEDSDGGALLIHDLSNRGGRIEIKRAKGVERFELPQTLDRRTVVSRFLFCIRDLNLSTNPEPER